MRRLYATARMQSSKGQGGGDRAGPGAKVVMHPTERAGRTDKLRARLADLKLDRQTMPTNCRIDGFAMMLAKRVRALRTIVRVVSLGPPGCFMSPRSAASRSWAAS